MRKFALVAGMFGGLVALGSPAWADEGPFTQAQLDKGKEAYNGHCRECHAKDGKGALGPALAGGEFKKRFGGQTGADARTWIHQNMPQNAPGSLQDDVLNPIFAYILSLNGFTPGQKELTADTAKDVTIPK